jgi:hypothetical protein
MVSQILSNVNYTLFYLIIQYVYLIIRKGKLYQYNKINNLMA